MKNIDKNNQSITFLIVMHNQFEAIDFFSKLFVSDSKEYKVLFVFDVCEKDIPNAKLELLRKLDFKFLFSKENIGKLKTVIMASHEIDTPFFKIVDQDDSIDLSVMSNVNRELSLLPDDALIKHVAAKVFKKQKDLFVQSLDRVIIDEQIKKGKDVNWAQQVNCDTIYPTKLIRQMSSVNLGRQDFHNDVLLSNFAVGLGSGLKKIKSKFYIHLHNGGQTSSLNVKRAECIVELYTHYLNIKEVYPEFKFRKLMLGLKISHLAFAKSFTKWYLKDEHGKNLYKESKLLIKKNWKQK